MTNYERQETKLLWDLFPREMLEHFKTLYGYKRPYYNITNLPKHLEQRRLEELVYIENNISNLKQSSHIYNKWLLTNPDED